jgi:arsenate reductase-like glutaredoxin family protein
LIDYTLEPLTPEKLTELVDMMEQEDLDLLVREGNYKDKTDIVKVLSENPSLMQRPILINSKMKKAVVGRPLERIESIL